MPRTRLIRAILMSYPSHQNELKQLLCNLRNTHHHTIKSLKPQNLFVGVGSDEAIDALLRCFCAPGRDKILVCPPTYGFVLFADFPHSVLVVAFMEGPAHVPALETRPRSNSRHEWKILTSERSPVCTLSAPK